MIQTTRIIGATLILGLLSWFLGRTVIEGLKTGSIRHTDSTQKCSRNENPIGFWSLILLFVGFVVMFIAVWMWVVTSAA